MNSWILLIHPIWKIINRVIHSWKSEKFILLIIFVIFPQKWQIRLENENFENSRNLAYQFNGNCNGNWSFHNDRGFPWCFPNRHRYHTPLHSIRQLLHNLHGLCQYHYDNYWVQIWLIDTKNDVKDQVWLGGFSF